MSDEQRKPYEDIRQEKMKEYNDWKKKVENTARFKEILDYGAVLYVLFKERSSSINYFVLVQIYCLKSGVLILHGRRWGKKARYSAVICEV